MAYLLALAVLPFQVLAAVAPIVPIVAPHGSSTASINEHTTAKPPLFTTSVKESYDPIASIEAAGLNGTITPSYMRSINITSKHMKGTPTTAGIPTPTGSPLIYPNPGDCNNVDSFTVSGPQKWKNANANATLWCFRSLYEEVPHFAGPNIPYDQALAIYYGFSNPDFQCSIDPTSPQAECQDDDRSCDSLVPLPLQPPPKNQTAYGYACDPQNTDLHHKATGWVLRQSMLNLDAYFASVKAALESAIQNVTAMTGDNGQFKKDFTVAPSDTTPTTRDALAIMNGLFGMAYASTSLFEDSSKQTFAIGVASTIAAGGASIGMANASASTNDPDLTRWVGDITSTIVDAYDSYSDDIFRTGNVTTHSFGGQPGNNVTLLGMFEGGQWAGSLDFGGKNQSAINLFEQGIYAALAQRAWITQDGLDPFIAVWPGDCKDESKLPQNFTAYEQSSTSTDFTDVSASIDGKCYSLLGAKGSNCPTTPPPGNGQSPGIWGFGRNEVDKRYTAGPGPSPCCSYQPLHGGSNGLLTGGANGPYGGLKLTDMIGSAVAGFNLNKQVNSFTPWNNTNAGPAQPQLPTNISSAGVVSSIPICDYTEPQAPGLNCPNLYNKSPGCSF